MFAQRVTPRFFLRFSLFAACEVFAGQSTLPFIYRRWRWCVRGWFAVLLVWCGRCCFFCGFRWFSCCRRGSIYPSWLLTRSYLLLKTIRHTHQLHSYMQFRCIKQYSMRILARKLFNFSGIWSPQVLPSPSFLLQSKTGVFFKRMLKW